MKFNILSYNVFSPVPSPLRFTGQVKRMERIPIALKTVDKEYGIDILLIQETIAHRDTLLKGLQKELGFDYFTDPIVHPVAAVSGGIIIASKTPFTFEKNIVFKGDCTDADCLAAKGVVYIKTIKGGITMNVFATHLQALDRPDIRYQQIDQLSSFVKSQNIPENEPYFIGGDLNFDRYADISEYEKWLSDTVTQMPPISKDSQSFTWDSKYNQLVGADGDIRYSECYEEYLNTLICECCDRSWYDYITHGSLEPISKSITAIALKMKEPFLVQLGSQKTKMIQDLSDHFPVIAEFEFDTSEDTKMFIPKKQTDNTFLILSSISFMMLVIMMFIIL